MPSPLIDQLTDRANDYARQLRAHTKKVADQPTSDGLHNLRALVKGVDQWRTRLSIEMSRITPRPDELTSAYLALSAASGPTKATSPSWAQDDEEQYDGCRHDARHGHHQQVSADHGVKGAMGMLTKSLSETMASADDSARR
jgi:hypothetical protein